MDRGLVAAVRQAVARAGVGNMAIGKERIAKAAKLIGFENYSPPVDVPALNRPRSRPEKKAGVGRVAGVLLLFYDFDVENDPNLHIVLTKRQADLSNHGGQISFPGGRQEGEETLWETAARESFEEIGIVGNQIEMLGELNPVYIPPSDFTVYPFIGWHIGRPKFVRCEDEVAEIIEVPLAQLLDSKTLQFGDIESASGMNINVPFYAVGNIQQHRVWGATAIMLGEMIERIRQAT